MKKRWIPAAAITAALLWATGYVPAQHHDGGGPKAMPPEKKAQSTEEPTTRPALPLCPVMGGPVDFSVWTMTDDGPVYFCCPGCIAEFEKNPSKYADKAAAQRQALRKIERVQVTCPVTGNPIDGKTFVFLERQGVDFCCENCPRKYLAAPANYQAKLEASYTYQTRCPVSGDKIDPTAFVDLAGQRIYLCCKDCSEKLTKDPAKYAANLKEQGVKLDLTKLMSQPEKKDRQHGQYQGEHGDRVRP